MIPANSPARHPHPTSARHDQAIHHRGRGRGRTTDHIKLRGVAEDVSTKVANEARRKQAQIDNLDNQGQRTGYSSRTENLVQLSVRAIDRQIPLIYAINKQSLTPCQRILNLRGRSRGADCKALNQLRATKTQCVPRKQNAVDQLIKLPIVVEIVRK